MTGIFLSRDEMQPDERLAFDLGFAAAKAESSAREERLREALDFYAGKSDERMNKEARQALHDVYGARREGS